MGTDMALTRTGVAIAALTLLLGGCASALPEAARQFKTLTERLNPPIETPAPEKRYAELGYAALLEGNYRRAETDFDAVLAINPDDPYALLNRGVVYQKTDRLEAARAAYQRVIALDPDATAVSATRREHVGQRLAVIARDNLARMDESADAASATRPLRERIARLAPARFATLARLRDAGLITAGEYEVRRQSNLGALLPLTGGPASPLLARPATPPRDVQMRLETIAEFKRLGALSEQEYATERAAILDALMPLGPGYAGLDVGAEVDMGAAMPPADPSLALTRLAELKTMGLISAAECERERVALLGDAAAQTPPPDTAAVDDEAPPLPASPPGAVERQALPSPSAEKTTPPTAEKTLAPSAARTSALPRVASGRHGALAARALHLASYRTPERARHGWDVLRRRNDDLLGDLGPRVARVDLGQGRGVFYQLRAGPVDDAEVASRCAALKRRDIYCAPTIF